MSDKEILRSERDYQLARMVVRVMIKRGVIPIESGTKEYLEIWAAAFEILDVIDEAKGEE